MWRRAACTGTCVQAILLFASAAAEPRTGAPASQRPRRAMNSALEDRQALLGVERGGPDVFVASVRLPDDRCGKLSVRDVGRCSMMMQHGYLVGASFQSSLALVAAGPSPWAASPPPRPQHVPMMQLPYGCLA